VYDVPSPNGKRRQKTETLLGVTKKQAEATVAAREAAVLRGEYGSGGDIRMNELFDRFMQVKSERLAPASLHRYDGLLGVYLRPTFGTRTVGSVKASDLVSAYARWTQRRISGRTVRHAADLMRNVLNRAVKWGILGRNPATLLDSDDLPKVVKPESTVLTEAELRQLLAEAKEPARRSQARGYLCAYSAFYPAVAFAAFTGARQGEVLAVRWRDVDLAAGEVTIRRSLTDSPRARLMFKLPKNDKPRTICISPQLVAILESHRAVQQAEKIAFDAAYRDEDLIFAKPDGTPIAPWLFSSAFRNFMKRSAVRRIRFHDLRDTHASLLAKAGVPIEVISKRLGHSTIGVTVDRYVTVYRDRDAAAAEAFERVMA
jgi:integrase